MWRVAWATKVYPSQSIASIHIKKSSSPRKNWRVPRALKALSHKTWVDQGLSRDHRNQAQGALSPSPWCFYLATWATRWMKIYKSRTSILLINMVISSRCNHSILGLMLNCKLMQLNLGFLSLQRLTLITISGPNQYSRIIKGVKTQGTPQVNTNACWGKRAIARMRALKERVRFLTMKNLSAPKTAVVL